MTNRVQAIRSSVSGTRPTVGTRAPGELYTNWPDRALGVIDASQSPVDLLAVRFFSALTSYVTGDFVQQGGQLYRAKAAVPAGAFTSAQWDQMAVVVPLPFVAKAGDAMTGPLTLPGDPSGTNDAATKHYVDQQISAAIAGITVPAPFPSGTVMLFYQASAPIGWTKLTTQNDKALRVVSGSGGVAGGSNPFSTVMAQSNTGGHTLTAGEIPSITSSGTTHNTMNIGENPNDYVPFATGGWTAINLSIGSGFIGVYSTGGIGSVNFVGGNINANVASTNTGGGPHSHPLTMAMQYVDVILASKN
jgi:hypothetical protein